MNMHHKTILIADDDVDLVESLRLRCQQCGLEVVSATDAVTTLATVDHHPPDLVCLDVEMPAGNGLSVCEMMASDERWRSIPVVILTGKTDQETIRRCHELRAFYVVKGGDIWSRIEPLLQELLGIQPANNGPADKHPNHGTSRQTAVEHDAQSKRDEPLQQQDPHREVVDMVFELLEVDPGLLVGATASQSDRRAAAVDSPPWVLHIEDDADFSETIKTRLEGYGVAVVRAFNGMQGYRTAFKRPADAIILDVDMPNGRGDYVLRRLKENPVTQKIPVIILTGRKDRALERTMLNLGAEKYMTKPYDFKLLLDELRRHMDVLPTPGVKAPLVEA